MTDKGEARAERAGETIESPELSPGAREASTDVGAEIARTPGGTVFRRELYDDGSAELAAYRDADVSLAGQVAHVELGDVEPTALEPKTDSAADTTDISSEMRALAESIEPRELAEGAFRSDRSTRNAGREITLPAETVTLENGMALDLSQVHAYELDGTDSGVAFIEPGTPGWDNVHHVRTREWADEYMLHGATTRRDGQEVSANRVVLETRDGVEHLLNAHEFAEVLRAGNGGEPFTKPIRLSACMAGQDPEGFSADLARELRVPIVAPRESIHYNSAGEAVAFPSTGLTHWRTFRLTDEGVEVWEQRVTEEGDRFEPIRIR